MGAQRQRLGRQLDDAGNEGAADAAQAVLARAVGKGVGATLLLGGERQMDMARQAGIIGAELGHERGGLALAPAMGLGEQAEKGGVVGGADWLAGLERRLEAARSKLDPKRVERHLGGHQALLQPGDEVAVDGRRLAGPTVVVDGEGRQALEVLFAQGMGGLFEHDELELEGAAHVVTHGRGLGNLGAQQLARRQRGGRPGIVGDQERRVGLKGIGPYRTRIDGDRFADEGPAAEHLIGDIPLGQYVDEGRALGEFPEIGQPETALAKDPVEIDDADVDDCDTRFFEVRQHGLQVAVMATGFLP